MLNRMVADLQGRRTGGPSKSNLMYYWRRQTGGKEVGRKEKKKGESGVVCGRANRDVDVGHRRQLWGQTVERGCKASHLMYEHV